MIAGDRPKWFPMWEGECAAIVAAGNSVKRNEVDMLKDRIHVVAINTSYELCKWADMLYACDSVWWQYKDGAKDFKGLKVTQAHEKVMEQWPEIKKVTIRRDHKAPCHDFIMDKYGEIGGGGNSGFQVLNLLAQFGVTAVALLGFDMAIIGEKIHWHGRHPDSGKYIMNNPSEANFRVWRNNFIKAAPKLAALGIDVVNCSLESTLGCFPKMNVETALKRWGL